MRYIQSTFLCLFLSISLSFAQQTQKIVIKTPTVLCEMCKARLEKYVISQPGITFVNADLKKKITTVTFIPDRINSEEIKAVIATAGFDADEVTAEPDSYAKLPKCCQKPDIKAVKDSTASKNIR